MEQCTLHTDLAVELGEIKTKCERSEKDVQEVWTVIHEIQGEIKKIMQKIAYIVGGIAALQTVLTLVLEYLKK
jgi:hypothetical protein